MSRVAEKVHGYTLSSSSFPKFDPSTRRLPLVDRIADRLSGLDLKNTLIISVQHLCSTTEVLFNSLLKFGLQPKNLYALGKCYSTDPSVLVRLRRKNINALFSSSSFNSTVPFDLDFDRNIDEMLKQVVSEKDLYSYEKIIIIDDGGHLLEKATRFLPQDLPIIGIEQTSSGFNRMKDKKIIFPVVNLARSWLKLEYESPIIINLVLKNLKEKLSKLNNSVKKILLTGHGVLGQEIYKILKDNYYVSIFDVLPEKSMIALKDFKKRLSEFDLIIGCTGATSLTSDDFSYLKKPVILASISSSDREFEAFKLRRLKPCKNCHTNVTVEGITLLNCGFPITFDEDYYSIDTDDFQLTRALILASIYQAATINPNMQGFFPMDDDLQQMILSELQQL